MVSSPPRTLSPRRGLSARQRAIYRRRRLAVGVLALVVLVLLVLALRAVVSALTGPESAAASLPEADRPVQLTLAPGADPVPLHATDLNRHGRINPGPQEAVWYVGHGRVTPGDLGTALLVGQTEHDGDPAALADLTSLAEGDRVSITFGDGVALQVEITSTDLLTEEELAQSEAVWGDQQEQRRVVLVSSDTITRGDTTGHLVAVAHLG